MKKAITIITLLVLATTVFAQQDTSRADRMKGKNDPQTRERIKAARAAYLTERLELTSAEAEKFWPVYREFAEKREVIYKKVKDARDGGKEDEAMLQIYHKARQEELDLERSYSGRFLQVISAGKLVKLHESEREFRKLMVRHAMKNRVDGRKKQMKQNRK